MKILILNSHSILNSGDAAIVLSQIRFLRRFFQNPKISVVSRTPKLDQKLYSPLGIKTLPPLIPAPSVFSGRMNQFQESVRNIMAMGSKFKLIQELKASDLVIASGGGYFWSNRKHLPGPMFLQNLLPVVLAGGLKRPMFFFPQSFGPLFNTASGSLLRKALCAPSVVKIFAREAQSLDFIKHLLAEDNAANKVDLAPDMAFLFDAQEDPAYTSSLNAQRLPLDLPRPQAVLTVREWDFPETDNAARKWEKQKNYRDSVAEICLGFHRRFQGSILILPQVRGPGDFENDRIISADLHNRLKPHIPLEALAAIDLPDALDPIWIQACIAQADVVIGTRFHSAIFALNADVPLFSLGYQAKSRETLRQLGLQAFSMPIENIEPEQALNALVYLMNLAPEQKAEIHRRVREMRRTLIAKLESALLPFRNT